MPAQTPRRTVPPCVVVTGVSGTGKTTTARLLAARLDLPFADADDFHPPANIAKMTAGIALSDADREPWLMSVSHWLRDRHLRGDGGVVACSALKRRYRDILRSAAPETVFLLLIADRETLSERISRRHGHYMPVSLLESQLATLEPLEPAERGLILHADRTPEAVADQAVAFLTG
ncbi:gluconokinase [Nocardia nova]|uniref:Gluconokinase n=1 Tax=Nocardia nova TaxID=37330 RepID=A0A2S6A0Y4_9NOCA|nr:gluconokinase [Nocardia nova]PPJ24779.1 gluconokinase [Nocardia nova]